MKDLNAIRGALKVLADNGVNSLDVYASMVIANVTELDQGDILVNFPKAVDVVADWMLSVGEAHSDKPIDGVLKEHVMPLMFDL